MITMEDLKQNGAEMFKAGSEAGHSGPVSWNDLTDKPFGVECMEELVSGVLTNGQEFGGTYDYTNIRVPDLISGETYVVVWDGESFTCTAVTADWGGRVLGNFAIPGLGADTGEPFFIFENHAAGFNNFTTAQPGDHMVSITVKGATKLDPKYHDPAFLTANASTILGLTFGNARITIEPNVTKLSDLGIKMYQPLNGARNINYSASQGTGDLFVFYGVSTLLNDKPTLILYGLSLGCFVELEMSLSGETDDATITKVEEHAYPFLAYIEKEGYLQEAGLVPTWTGSGWSFGNPEYITLQAKKTLPSGGSTTGYYRLSIENGELKVTEV